MDRGSGIRREFNDAFVLDEAKLRKVADILKAAASKASAPLTVRYFVETEDDRFFRSADIEDVLQHDNAPGRSIATLIVELRGEGKKEDFPDHETRAAIDVNDADKPRAMVSFRLNRGIVLISTGPDRDWCFLLIEELVAQAQRIITKRSSIVITKIADRMFGILVATLLMGFAVMGFVDMPKVPPALTLERIPKMTIDERTAATLALILDGHKASSHIKYVFPVLSAAIVALLVLPELKLLSRLAGFYWQSAFYWGDMKITYDKRRRMLTQVLWGLVIAFLISVVAAIFVGHLPKWLTGAS